MERIRQERTNLVVSFNPEYLKLIDQICLESDKDLNTVMDKILKIGTGCVEKNVFDGADEVHVHFGPDGKVGVEEFKHGTPIPQKVNPIPTAT